ncbi:T9SS type A sorting domain-containing protein [bacterium]|nr:T9SS type A sorting domain-containing protein [bacterium]
MINKFKTPLLTLALGSCFFLVVNQISEATVVQKTQAGPRKKVADISAVNFAIGQDLVRAEGGLQGLVFDNDGKWSFDRDDRADLSNKFTKFKGWLPRLEYPINTGTEFLFTAGIWVGGLVNGQKIVSVSVDGDDGTAEYGRIATWFTSSKKTFAKSNDEDGDWAETFDWNRNGEPTSDFDGVPGLDDDGDGAIDEEKWNGLDDDGDGLVDEDIGCLPLSNGTYITRDSMITRTDLRQLVLDFPTECDGRFAIDEWIKKTDLESGKKPFAHNDIISGNEIIHFPGDANGDLVFDYDPEPKIDEDPSGDKAHNLIDDDFDGLFDASDPDFDGDTMPCENDSVVFKYYEKVAKFAQNDPSQPEAPELLACFDDDGDELIDEDQTARATNEYFIGYADTIASELKNLDGDGFTPMGIVVTQKIQTFEESFADDFMIMDFEIRNVGNATIKSTYIGIFLDYDVCHTSQDGVTCSENDITYYKEDKALAIGGNDGTDGGLLASELFGVKVLYPNPKSLTVTYKNFSRNQSEDPPGNNEKFDMLSSGSSSPDRRNRSDWRMLIAFGPIGDMVPGQTQKVSIALVNGVNEEQIIKNADQSKAQFDSDLKGPSTPIAPAFKVVAESKSSVKIFWDNNSETQTFDKWIQDEDPVQEIKRRKDFEGYRVWRTENGGLSYTLLKQFDLPNNGVDLDLGMPKDDGVKFLIIDSLDVNGNVQIDTDSTSISKGFAYKFTDAGLSLGKSYQYVVTAFDNGDNGDGIGGQDDVISVLETSRGNLQSVRVSEPLAKEGSTENQFSGEVYVVPNPYIGSHGQEANQDKNSYAGNVAPRILAFHNVPLKAKITVFTLAGEKIITLNNSGTDRIVKWDLRKNGAGTPEVAAGIYIYKVEAEGSTQVDKFVVIK